MLYERVVGGRRTGSADGTVERALDLDTVRAELARAKLTASTRRCRLMHAYRYSDHEQQVAALARDLVSSKSRQPRSLAAD